MDDKNHAIPIIIALIALFVAVISLFRVYPSVENAEVNYSDIMVGILSILVTILLGWNIYSALELKEEWREYKSKIEKLESALKEQEKIYESNIAQMKREIDTISHYGYAITDFCQAYIKLEPEKKNYLTTYCKLMNSLRNFLKTKEKLDWYAPACVENIKEALNKAEELNEKNTDEIEGQIRRYINEIRICDINGFEKYWEQIQELENRRKQL